MTIEQSPRAGSKLGKLCRSVTILAGLVVGWFGVMAVLMLLTEAAPAALVIVPDMKILHTAPADIKLMRGGRHILVLASERPGYVTRIYRAGAWLVLPALRNGCLDLRAVSSALLIEQIPDAEKLGKQ